jgi:hypothetical protein
MLVCLAVPMWFVSGSAFAKNVWDGVYTSTQAQRGQIAYTQYCVTCHKADLVGIDGAMKGDSFMERRREDSLETTASLVIEDSERGLKAAMEAGIRCIIVPNEFTRRSNFAGAYRVAENLTDLLKELRMKTEN